MTTPLDDITQDWTDRQIIDFANDTTDLEATTRQEALDNIQQQVDQQQEDEE